MKNSMKVNCRYCAWEGEQGKVYLKHLNEQHIKCGVCFKEVFDKKEFDDGYAICRTCRDTGRDPRYQVVKKLLK